MGEGTQRERGGERERNGGLRERKIEDARGRKRRGREGGGGRKMRG